MIADSEAMSKMVSIVDGNEEDGMSGLGDDSNSNTVVKQCGLSRVHPMVWTAKHFGTFRCDNVNSQWIICIYCRVYGVSSVQF